MKEKLTLDLCKKLCNNRNKESVICLCIENTRLERKYNLKQIKSLLYKDTDNSYVIKYLERPKNAPLFFTTDVEMYIRELGFYDDEEVFIIAKKTNI